MGLFTRDEVQTRTFVMREKLLGFGNDFWIEDEEGNHAFKVDGKRMRIRDTWVLEDTEGNEIAMIRERKLGIRDAMKLEVRGHKALVRKQLISIGEKYDVEIDDDEDLLVKGDIIGHEYTIERDGDTVAEISQKHFRMRDTYGIEVRGAIDPALIICVAVAVESLQE